MASCTITGPINNVNNQPFANKWIKFTLGQVGTDATAGVTVAQSSDSVQTDASGDFTIDIWDNGESGVESILEIKVEGSRPHYVIIPQGTASIELWDLIENHQALGADPQWPQAFTKGSFIVSTSTLTTVSNDIDAPNLITSFATGATEGFTLRPSDGAMQNNVGRDIAGIVGNIAMQINNVGGGTKTLHFWSETSADGITFTPIANSLRVFECAASNESFLSTVSFTNAWPSGHWIRFVFYSTGGMEFYSPTITSDGDVVNGRSVVWELTEQ